MEAPSTIEKEYLTLREEIQTELQAQRNLLTFSTTATITLIGFALDKGNDTPEMFLLPLVVLFLSSVKVRNYKINMTRIASYMMVRCEDKKGFWWEHSLNAWREEVVSKRSLREKIVAFFETQEYSLLGILCFGLFVAKVGTPIPGKYRFLAILSMVAIGFIIMESTDYWNLNAEKVNNNKEDWIIIFNKFDKIDSEKEKCDKS